MVYLLNMVIFHGYVKYPEGICNNIVYQSHSPLKPLILLYIIIIICFPQRPSILDLSDSLFELFGQTSTTKVATLGYFNRLL